MPLKHLTETILIVILAAATALVGFVVSVLPPLPTGFFLWSILFAITFLYPVLLYRFFREHRADYAFRVLHFAPLAIVLLWLVLQILAGRVPGMPGLLQLFTAWHGLVPVLLVFAGLALFCLQVIRRRVPRLSALGAMAAAVLVFAFLGASRGWDNTVTGSIIALSERAGFVTGSGAAVSSRGSGTGIVAQQPRSSARAVAVASSKGRSSSSARQMAARSSGSLSSAPPTPAAPHLPTSGLGGEAVATVMMAGYCSVLHIRARKRMRA